VTLASAGKYAGVYMAAFESILNFSWYRSLTEFGTCRHEDNALELVLMKLYIPGKQPVPKSTLATEPLATPTFTSITKFKTSGMVLNVFILNHVLRILCAYIWLPASNTIGLYVIPDWSREEYVFVDTTIPCVSPYVIIVFRFNVDLGWTSASLGQLVVRLLRQSDRYPL
jgi:hypothetical protein